MLYSIHSVVSFLSFEGVRCLPQADSRKRQPLCFGGFAKANSVSVLFGAISFVIVFLILSLKVLCFEYVISNVFQIAMGLLSVLFFCNSSLYFLS